MGARWRNWWQVAPNMGHDSAKVDQDGAKMVSFSSTWEVLEWFWEHFEVIWHMTFLQNFWSVLDLGKIEGFAKTDPLLACVMTLSDFLTILRPFSVAKIWHPAELGSLYRVVSMKTSVFFCIFHPKV